MTDVQIRVPLDHVLSRISAFTWRDALFGMNHELLEPGALVQLASVQLTDQTPPRSLLWTLAELTPGESSRELVEALASSEPPQDESETKAKWLYLVLSFLFEHISGLPDPLDMVERVYADFDYPESIAPFVRYMPAVEPSLGSVAKNEERLIEYWKAYLLREGARWRG